MGRTSHVDLEAVTQGYNRKKVLCDLTLGLGPGVVGLLGPNGAGKTTLLRTIATISPPQEGSIFIDGDRIRSAASARRARRRIGYLPQSFGYPPRMLLRDFLEYGAWLREVPRRQWPAAVTVAAEAVGLQGELNARMRSLSGGMIQRAGIGWALVGQPDLVLLDEPTVGLDPMQRVQFRTMLRDVAATTVVLSTHLTEDVGAVCDRVIVLDSGAVRFDGGVEEMSLLGAGGAKGVSAIEQAYIELVTPDCDPA